MTRAKAAWLLWLGAWLLLPLPYFIIANGRVPVVRIAFLAAISVGYAGFIDGSGVAWPMAYILLSHVVLYSILLAVGAALASNLIPQSVRRQVVWTSIIAGFTVALLFHVYRTPFDDVSIYSTWLGLFQ